MTDKEIDIQTALGTLPLWKRIELGEVEFTSTRSSIYSSFGGGVIITIECEGLQDSYSPEDQSGHSKRRAIQRMIHKSKKLKL
ncbi:hypothetical protein LCGC14_1039480 [marine sediment metagenome]|uniref:Uncharacterized protein n=1 Tax=marine sediment metagenome TaxID=412755 RepID=A0A0F9MS80_9ZZZZ